MACPFFLPLEPNPLDGATGRPRPPLGEFYAGACSNAAGSDAAEMPLEFCNLGYARGQPCFAADAAIDAVRFSIADDNGQTIRIRFCLEHNHRPVRWGEHAWSRPSQAFISSPKETALEQQMRAYIGSYLSALAQGRTG